MSYGSPEYDELLDAFKCELCSGFYQGLSSHLHFKHNITVKEYKKMFGLNKQFPLLGYTSRQKMSEKALKNRNLFKKNKFNRVKKGEVRYSGKLRAQARKVKVYKPVTIKVEYD